MIGPGEYLLGWLELGAILGLALASAHFISRRFVVRPTLWERGLAVGFLTWAHVVFCALALGAAGLLRPHWLMALLAALAAGSFALARKAPRPLHAPGPSLRDDPVNAALAGLYAVAGITLAERGLGLPPLAWDALQYHLPFVAEWIQTGSLAPLYHPHAVFQSYFPATGEIAFWAVAAPFGNDLFVGVANLPLLALQGLAIYRTAVRAGAPPAHARLAPALVLVTPCVARLAPAAYVEPAFGAALLCAVAFLLDYRAQRRPADLALCLAALGILVGIKYTGLLYGLPVGLAALAYAWRTPGKRALLVGLPLLALGAYWYWRNLWLTGHPFYPSPVRIFGLEIFSGIAKPLGAARLGHDVTILSALPDLLASGELTRALLGVSHPDRFELGIGPKLVPLAVLALVSALRLRSCPDLRLPVLLLLLFALFFATTPLWILHWLYINVRFAAPALAMAAVAAVTTLSAFGVAPRWAALLSGLCIAPDLFSLKIHLSDGFRVAALLAAGAGAVWMLVSRAVVRPWVPRIAVAALSVLAILGGYAVHAHREDVRSSSLATEWELYRTSASLYARGWAALERALPPGRARIAHAGFAFVYPLYGPRLDRRVLYIDVNARAGGAIHAYPEARFRADPDERAWLANLKRARVEWLVVHHPDPGVPGPWPIEARWADARPDRFAPIHRDDWIRVYRVLGSTPPGHIPEKSGRSR
jgi:hypothetical protein